MYLLVNIVLYEVDTRIKVILIFNSQLHMLRTSGISDLYLIYLYLLNYRSKVRERGGTSTTIQ